MALERRVSRLEQQAGDSDADDEDVTIILVSDGEVTQLTPEQWRQWRREHPDRDIITVKER